MANIKAFFGGLKNIWKAMEPRPEKWEGGSVTTRERVLATGGNLLEIFAALLVAGLMALMLYGFYKLLFWGTGFFKTEDGSPDFVVVWVSRIAIGTMVISVFLNLLIQILPVIRKFIRQLVLVTNHWICAFLSNKVFGRGFIWQWRRLYKKSPADAAGLLKGMAPSQWDRLNKSDLKELLLSRDREIREMAIMAIGRAAR